MSQASPPGAPERDLNVTLSSSELRVLREAVNTCLDLAPTGELPKEAEALGPLGDLYATRLAAGQPPQPPPAPLEERHRPQIARIAPELYAVHDWQKGKVHEGPLEDGQKVVCCLKYEQALRARASAKYPDPSPEDRRKDRGENSALAP